MLRLLQARLDANLRAGKIQATLFSPPQNFAAQGEGFNLLADVADLGLPFVHVVVATTRGFVRDNPETVRRYVKSYIEAIQLMKTDREIGIEVLGKYLRSIKEREILAKTYDGAIPDNKFSRKQYPSIPGLQMALDLLAEENPKAKSAKPEDFVDASKNWIKAATSMGCTKLKKIKRMSSQLMRGSLFRPCITGLSPAPALDARGASNSYRDTFPVPDTDVA